MISRAGRSRIFSAILLGAAPLAAAQKPDVRATLVAPAHLAPGTTAVVLVELTIGPGWHVNSHTPSEKYLVPTDVALRASAGTLSSIRYPKDLEKRFSFSDKPLRVYEGKVRFEADFTMPSGGGPVSIRGEVTYQACNDQQCFAPAKIPLTVSIGLPPDQAK